MIRITAHSDRFNTVVSNKPRKDGGGALSGPRRFGSTFAALVGKAAALGALGQSH